MSELFEDGLRSQVLDVYDKMRDVVHHLVLTLAAMLHLVGAIMRPTINVLRPYFVSLARALWRHFAAQSWQTIALQSTTCCAAAVLLVVEKRYAIFSRSYHAVTRTVRTWQDALRSRSRTAAAALPHVLFIGAVVLVEYLLWGRVPAYVRSLALLVVSRLLPSLSSIRLLSRKKAAALKADENGAHEHENTNGNGSTNGNGRTVTELTRRRRPRTQHAPVDDENADQLKEDKLLNYWAVLSLILGVRQAIYFLCPSIFIAFLVRVDICAFYAALWLRNSTTNGTAVGYRILSAITGRRFEARSGGDRRAEIGVFLSILVGTGLLSDRRAKQVSATLAESSLSLVGLVFLITPSLVTFFGTVLIGWLAPAYLNLHPGEQRAKWLAYFAVYALADSTFEMAARPLAWFPLLYHAKMVGILWLQLPFYQGAQLVVDRIHSFRPVAIALNSTFRTRAHTRTRHMSDPPRALREREQTSKKTN